MEIKIFENNTYPIYQKDIRGKKEDFSVDVFTVDEDGLMNVAYWDYEEEKWKFHADTLTDPYEKGMLVSFVWMYKPESLHTKNSSYPVPKVLSLLEKAWRGGANRAIDPTEAKTFNEFIKENLK